MYKKTKETKVPKTFILSEKCEWQIRAIAFNNNLKQYEVVEEAVALLRLLMAERPKELDRLLAAALNYQDEVLSQEDLQRTLDRFFVANDELLA